MASTRSRGGNGGGRTRRSAAKETPSPAASKPRPKSGTQTYRCLANISACGKNHTVGGTVRLTDAQAKPILEHLVLLEDEAIAAKRQIVEAQERLKKAEADRETAEAEG